VEQQHVAVLRSTSVPTAEAPAFPMIKSPSQWPERPISHLCGRSLIITMSAW